MKGFMIILVLVGLGVGGYFAWENGYLDGLMGSEEEVVNPPAAPSTPPATPPPAAPSNPGTAPQIADTATPPQPAPTPPASPEPAPAPEPQMDELDRQIAEKIPMPTVRPLDEITQNWTAVPPNAVPDMVKVNVPVEYEMRGSDGEVIGKSTTPAGHDAIPTGLRDGQLQLSNDERSIRGSVSVDDTDFKQQIQTTYDTFVEDLERRTLAARTRERQIMEMSSGTSGEPAAVATGSAPDDPRFAPVRQYLADGNLQSGILEEAVRWVWLGREGQYDVVLVDFEVDTLFGKFPNSMKCLLQNGEVVKWVDAETGEDRI